jgi:hypothetical protein
LTHDRVPGDTFPLSQEFLGQMLGVARPGVTLAARVLQHAGLITYHRGVITVRDRAGLEGRPASATRSSPAPSAPSQTDAPGPWYFTHRRPRWTLLSSM